MKRTLSDTESDLDDMYEPSSVKGTHQHGGSESCQMLNRKKRRGVIEKRRRDRINNSLTELRRLVPTAYEKQGSAKLEKAEILQMTVDHLKMLHSKGYDSLAYDPNKYAMDYHGLGFRECASEVARYLVTQEGLDVQDPLRLRLMSHLQCFASQRDFTASKPPAPAPAPHSSAWSPFSAGSATSSSQYSPSMPDQSLTSSPHHPISQTATVATPFVDSRHHHHHQGIPTTDMFSPSMGIPMGPHGVRMATQGGQGQYGTPMGLNHHFPTLSPTSAYSSTPTSTSGHQNAQQQSSNNQSQSMKPYRPWGAELAY